MKKIIYIIALIFINLNYASAQWNNLNAPSSTSPDYYLYLKMAVSLDGKNIATYCSKLQISPFLMENKYIVSSNYGTSWAEHSAPANSTPNDMFWDGNDLFVKYPSDSALKKSTDYGANFSNQNPNFFSTTMSENILMSSNNKWYLVKNVGLNQFNLQESANKGVSWSNLGSVSVSANPNFFEYLFANNGNVVSTSVAGTSYSTDNGVTWTASTFPNGITVSQANCISKASDGDIILFEFSQKKIYRSTDNGVNYTLVNSTNLPSNSNRCAYYQNDLICICLDGSTHKSTDDGASFIQLTAPGAILESAFGSGNEIMIETTSNIYIAGKNKIYRYGNLSTGIEDKTEEINYLVYPNPAKDFVILNNLPASSTIKMYDVTGKQVYSSSITNEQTIINTSTYTNGIYLISIENNRGITYKKLVVTK